MKALYLFIFFLVCSGFLSAQNKKLSKEERAAKSVEVIDGKMLGIIPWKDGSPYYSEVITVDASKDDLYIRSRSWFAETFKDSRSVLQMDDKEAGIVIGKGAYFLNSESWISFTIKVQSREGRYKFDLFDIVHHVTVYGYTSGLTKNLVEYTPYELLYNKKGKQDTAYAERLNNNISVITSKLESAMTSIIASDNETDW